jgi:hypothetical protein
MRSEGDVDRNDALGDMNYVDPEPPQTSSTAPRRKLPRGWTIVGLAAAAWFAVVLLGIGAWQLIKLFG